MINIHSGLIFPTMRDYGDLLSPKSQSYPAFAADRYWFGLWLVANCIKSVLEALWDHLKKWARSAPGVACVYSRLHKRSRPMWETRPGPKSENDILITTHQCDCRSPQSSQCCWAPSAERWSSSPQPDTLPLMSGYQWRWTQAGKTDGKNWENTWIHIYTRTHTYIHIHMCTYICICTYDFQIYIRFKVI